MTITTTHYAVETWSNLATTYGSLKAAWHESTIMAKPPFFCHADFKVGFHNPSRAYLVFAGDGDSVRIVSVVLPRAKTRKISVKS